MIYSPRLDLTHCSAVLVGMIKTYLDQPNLIDCFLNRSGIKEGREDEKKGRGREGRGEWMEVEEGIESINGV